MLELRVTSERKPTAARVYIVDASGHGYKDRRERLENAKPLFALTWGGPSLFVVCQPAKPAVSAHRCSSRMPSPATTSGVRNLIAIDATHVVSLRNQLRTRRRSGSHRSGRLPVKN